jgi:hypothetical protein
VTHRSRRAIEAALVALTVLVVLSAPLWTLPVFLYVCGGVMALVSLVPVWMLLGLFVGFRVFEYRTGKAARRIFGRRALRMVRR